MKLYVAIPTYNRPELLQQSLRSISKADLQGPLEFHLFDDCSDQVDWPGLRREFPFIGTLHLAEKNEGADQNILRMLKAFSQSDASHLFILDSDSLVNKEAFQFALNLTSSLPLNSLEIWSLYRSRFHTELKVDQQNQRVEKASLGALGMILPRGPVQEFLKTSFIVKGLDWQMIFFMAKKGFRFYTPLASLVQHIGWEGSHNRIGSPDYGLDFVASNPTDQEILDQLKAKSREQSIELKSRLLTFYRLNVNSLFRFRLRQWLRQRVQP